MTDKFSKERDYWLEKLSGELTKTFFPYDSRETEKGKKAIDKITFRLTGSLYAHLLRISNKSDVRLHIILVVGWLILLHRYTGSSDIILGIPTYKQEVEGDLLNTVLALRNRVAAGMTVKELLLQVGETILAANKNQNYPINTLVYKLNLPVSGDDFPLFDISVLLEGLHDKGGLYHIRQNMVVCFRQLDDVQAVEGVIEYNSGVYRETTMQRIVSHFRNLLAAALSDVDTPVSRLEILSPQERKQLVEDFNDNAADFPRDKTVPQLIEEQAEKNPDSIAVIGSELCVGADPRVRPGRRTRVQVTYRELNKKSGQLAHILKEKGMMPETIAAIMMERSIDIVVSILGVWSAEGAYLPIDPADPQERIDYMLEDSGAEILLTGGTGHTLRPAPRALRPAPRAPRLAYIIYTSGSTGKPKGAMVEHIGMMNHLQAKIDLLQITDKSITAQNTSQTFDISVWQFFVALVQGGRTVIYPDSLILDPAKLIGRLIQDGATILEVVPSYLSVALAVINNRGGEDVPPLMLDYLLVTGEEVKPKLVTRWFETYPHIKVVNAYGPTEASDDITHHVMDKAPAPGTQRIPIGKPVQNLNIYIVDEHMNLCPVGVKGEICVSGVGVGRGYLGDEAKTRMVFMDDPFIAEKNVRLYKTGDLGRWLPDGSVEFFGRKDYQVKIMGVRIELGEIENHLLTHPAVKEAVVIDREDEKSGKYLCAYIVGTGTGIGELRNYLKQLVPDYMMPAHFTALDKLPLTANGKIDRKALPAPENRVDDIPYISAETLNRLEREYGSPGEQRQRQPVQPAADIRGEYAKLEGYSKEKGKTYYPLSHTQKLFYYNDKLYLGNALGTVMFSVKYREILDPELLNEAVNEVLARSPGLRLRIVELEMDSLVQPAQYVAPHHPYRMDSLDFPGEGRGFDEWVREDIARPFQLKDSQLFYFAYIKFSRQESGYYVKTHHIAADSFAFRLVFADIHRTYRRLQAGTPAKEEPAPSFTRYLSHRRDYLTSPQFEKDREFWHKTLLPLPPEADIASRKGDRAAVDPFRIAIETCILEVPAELRTRLHEFCKRRQTTLFSLILSALSIYVSRVTGLEDFTIVGVNHGRSTALHRKIVGLAIDFFPIRITIGNSAAFEEFVGKNTRDVRHIVKNHARYPYDLLLAELQEITGQSTRGLNNINIVGHPDVEMEYETEFLHASHSPTPLDLHINMSNKDKDGILELGWEYQVERFDKDDIIRIHRGLVAILAEGLQNPGRSLGEIEVPLEEAGKTSYSLVEEHTVLERYSREVAKTRTYYPLSYSQKQFYYNEKSHGQTFTTNIFYTVKYPGVLDRGVLNEAINKVLLKNPGLRLRMVELTIGKFMRPAQYVAPYKPYVLDVLNFSAEDGGGHDRGRFGQWAAEAAGKPFALIDSDLFYFAYIKYDANETGYCFNFHHLVFDGWTQFLVFDEIHRLYRRLKEGKTVDDEPNPSYIRYLADEKEYLTSAGMKRDREFWHKTLLPLPPEADISSRKGSLFQVETNIATMRIPGSLSMRMHDYCRAHGTSIFKLMLSVLSVYVSRATGLEDFVIGSINHGRSNRRHKQTAGVLVDFFPIRVTLESSMTFNELVKQNAGYIDEAVKNHIRYPYAVLAGELREIAGKDTWFFGNINLVDHPNLQVEEYTFRHHPCHHDPNPLNIHIIHLKAGASGMEAEEVLELEWEYQAARFSGADIAGIYRALLAVLDDVLDNSHKSLPEIRVLSEEDRHQVLYEFNATAAEFPADKTLHRLFEEQAARTPANTAVREAGNPIPLTYEELNKKSNQLARFLRARSVTAGSTAAVLVKRSFEMIIGMLAVLKAGGAYMPIGLTYPDKRIDYMCSDTGAGCILTDNTRELPGKAALMIDVTEKSLYNSDSSNLPRADTSRGSRDPAAVFYTSGSTGVPKGVIDEHRGLVNRLWWLNQLYPMEETDVILQQTPVIFDVSVWELFSWSFWGASLYLLGPTVGDKTGDIVEAVIEGGVTHMHIPPAHQLSTLHYIETEGKLKEVSGLKWVLASGEALLPAHVNAFNRLLYRAHGTRLINLYGPTEASIEVSYFDCASDLDLEKIPIGKPIHNIRLLIVDKNLEPVPVGVPGQLCISGVGLARGYLNSPELTADKFCLRRPGGRILKKLPPWTPRKNFCLTRLYTTGDLVKWMEDGNIEFLGRIDDQVQLGGIRIELGEVESILLKHGYIREAVVVARKDEKGQPFLCAFIKAAGDLGGSDFRESLARELPRYMLPTAFVELEKIPRTPTGKVNRKLLEAVDLKIGAPTEYAAPKTEKENLVAAVWKEVLNLDNVGIHDNFFDIGGNSLGIIQVNFKLKELFKRDIPALIMFEHPTIASIIDYLEKNPWGGSEPGQDEEEKDRTEVKGKGRNRMQQRKGKLKQARNR